jgi:hypothetical protein
MYEKKTPDQQLAGTEATRAEWVTKMSLLGASNRDAYRALREAMWRAVVENSAYSDFPSEMS